MPNDDDDTIKSIFDFILKKKPNLIHEAINQRRELISNLVYTHHNMQVAYGPFKGLKLGTDTHWGIADKGAITLGLYEKDVLDELVKLKDYYSTFIDLGAADGYYGIGVIVGQLFNKSYCFEITEKGREVILKNSIINEVDSKIIIHGIAEKNFHNKIAPEDINNSVLFVDIEGAEFELFDEDIFRKFDKSVIFIELHDWFYSDAQEKIAKLKIDSQHTHFWTEIKMGVRDLSQFSELDSLNDSDRWLLCSEGRARNMTWAKLHPIKD